MRHYLFFSLFILPSVSCFFLSCEKNILEPVFGLDDVKYDDYEIKILPYNDLPYSWWIPATFDNYLKDENGVIMFNVQGWHYYHPTQIAQKMLHFLASYRRTQDDAYVTETEKFGRKMLELAVEKQGALFFPVPFNWNLGGFGYTMIAPWYSGMSQGQLLSAFVKLYEVTNDEYYLNVSDKILISFTLLKGQCNPWISYVDEDQYYWIEEYPEQDPNHVFNGFVFALYGLYDYYRVMNDEVSLKLLRAGIKTIVDHIIGWRVKGEPSKYSIKYSVAYEDYHLIHTEQLEKLAQITGDQYLNSLAALFKSDFSKE